MTKNAMRTVKILLLFCCMLGFAYGDDTEESSDEAVTVSEVADAASLRDFVEYAARRLQDSADFAEAMQLINEFREVGGDWNDGFTYLVILTKDGGLYIHSKNRKLEDQDWSNVQDARGKNVGQLFLDGGFVEYHGTDDEPEMSYAFPFAAPSVPLTSPFTPEEQGLVLIGGFHHEPPEVSEKASYEQLSDSYNLRRFHPSTEARYMDTRQELKQFVEEAISLFTGALAPSGSDIRVAEDDAGDIDVVLLRRLFRLEGGPWREGSTYIYILESEGNVIFHGANRDIEQKNVLDSNADDPDILEIIQELIALGKQGGGFLEYNWDDPSVVGDEPEDGSPGGDSPKLGYAKAIQINKGDEDAEPIYYIFGSGIYFPQQTVEPPQKPESESGGGCAILAQAGNTSQSALLNLFLVLSGIFSFVILVQRRD